MVKCEVFFWIFFFFFRFLLFPLCIICYDQVCIFSLPEGWMRWNINPSLWYLTLAYINLFCVIACRTIYGMNKSHLRIFWYVRTNFFNITDMNSIPYGKPIGPPKASLLKIFFFSHKQKQIMECKFWSLSLATKPHSCKVIRKYITQWTLLASGINTLSARRCNDT